MLISLEALEQKIQETSSGNKFKPARQRDQTGIRSSLHSSRFGIKWSDEIILDDKESVSVNSVKGETKLHNNMMKILFDMWKNLEIQSDSKEKLLRLK